MCQYQLFKKGVEFSLIISTTFSLVFIRAHTHQTTGILEVLLITESSQSDVRIHYAVGIRGFFSRMKVNSPVTAWTGVTHSAPIADQLTVSVLVACWTKAVSFLRVSRHRKQKKQEEPCERRHGYTSHHHLHMSGTNCSPETQRSQR